MSCLRIILLFTLIYFALQDDELCYIKFNICRSHIPVSESNVITNCMKFKESICDLCEDGYASSYNGKSCISFPNCNELKEGDKECDDCYNGFYPINDGKECKIIPFENCKYIANIGNDITDIDSFVFFTDENNLEVVSAFSHCEANLQINTVKRIVDSQKDDLVYNEPFSQKVK